MTTTTKKSKWPILGVRDLDKSVVFYTNRLFFKKSGDETPDSIKIEHCRFFLHLTIRDSGPVYHESSHTIIPNKGVSTSLSPSLWIPVDQPKRYYDEIKKDVITVLCRNKMLGSDFEGFYILDPEGNKILFFKDYHGPYDPMDWKWSWNDYQID